MLADSYTSHGSTTDGGGNMIGNFNPDGYGSYIGAIHVIHGGKANLGFYDAHCQSLSMRDINEATASHPVNFYDEQGAARTLTKP